MRFILWIESAVILQFGIQILIISWSSNRFRFSNCTHNGIYHTDVYYTKPGDQNWTFFIAGINSDVMIYAIGYDRYCLIQSCNIVNLAPPATRLLEFNIDSISSSKTSRKVPGWFYYLHGRFIVGCAFYTL